MDSSLQAKRPSVPSELVARLEVASEGSRELDDSVVIAATNGEMMDWWDDAAQQHVIRAGDGSRVNVAPVTTSLDAALALAERVLPNMAWTVCKLEAGNGLAANGPFYAVLETDNDWDELFEASAATPALALCIAILKATTALPADSVGTDERSEGVNP